MLKITEILMDYEKEQTGMDHMPQLGWKLESDGRNIQQEAYELDIALDQDFCDCVYRSGKVMENASAQIMVDVYKRHVQQILCLSFLHARILSVSL